MFMNAGERIWIRAYKSDGTCYRTWQAVVEAVDPGCITVVTPVGHHVQDAQGGWYSQYAIRGHYWLGEGFSLLEVFSSQGDLVEIYVNIGSPVVIGRTGLRFTDYELDVSRIIPGEARIVDEEEFQQASSKFGYSIEFRENCYQIAQQAVQLATNWIAGGMPDFTF